LKAIIKAISYVLPKDSLTHEELCERFGADVMKKIASVTGIKNRRRASTDVCASDMAYEAARLLFEKTKINKNEIDLLIMATQTPDYLMPTTACILQDRLALKKSCAAFDINLGCSQYVYALSCANAYLKSSMAKKVLILTGDTVTRTIHPLDKSSVTIFGDGATATLLELSDSNGLIDFDFGTDGSSHKDLIIPALGFRHKKSNDDFLEIKDVNGNIRTNYNMYINGIGIFSFANKIIPQSINNLLEKNSLKISDIDLFIFHQAGEKIIRHSAKKLNIPEEKLHFKMSDIGNCGGSSIGIALADASIKDRLKVGQKIVFSAFGVGLSWSSVLLEWSDEFIGAYSKDL